MIFNPVSIVHVYYVRRTEKCSMGRLALKNRQLFFEYNPEFLKTELELSPFKLPLKSGVIISEERLFDGLFGIFNRDDHPKNFSFLMDEQGSWRVSPSYDLTFSYGVATEHCTMIMGEGKTPTLNHMLKLAAVGNIKKQRAIEVIEEIKSAVSQWEIFAQNADVTKKSASFIQTAINQVNKAL